MSKEKIVIDYNKMTTDQALKVSGLDVKDIKPFKTKTELFLQLKNKDVEVINIPKEG